MNDFMHCNKCFVKYNNPNVKLFLTECAHILCERCVKCLNESKCIICDKPTKSIPISKDMDVTIQQFFIPFEIHLKRASEIYNFQMQHRTRLFQRTIQSYNFAKQECLSSVQKSKNLARENKILRTMLNASGQNNQQPFLTSTPFMKSDISQVDNASVISSSIGFTPNIGARAVARPGAAQRVMNSGMNYFKEPHLPMVPGSGGSSLIRPSQAQMVPNMERKPNIAPVHRSLGAALSMEQLRRAGKRT